MHRFPSSPGLDLLTSFPVTAIHYSPNGAVLRGPGGRELRARKVVVTAPLRVLQVTLHPKTLFPAH
jgi:protoporphyrinogen oxidase